MIHVKKLPFMAVLICGSLVLTMLMGLRQSMGLFLKPMTIELEIGREVFALGLAISNLLWGAVGPFAGMLADKYGTGRSVLIGGALYALGFWALSEAQDGTLIYVGNVLQGFAMAGAGFSIILGAVGRAAPPEKRSWALGIVSAGGSFGQFAFVPYASWFLSTYDWHFALFALGLTALTILPLARGVAGYAAPPAARGAQSAGEALREAMGHSGFWLLTIGFFVCGFQVVFVAVHLPAYIADKGLEAWSAAWALALVGLFNIVGTFAVGKLIQRWPKPHVLAGIYLCRAIAIAAFVMLPLSPATVYAFAVAMGLLWLSTV
ncbi:MAG: MFS transporter, partial [Tagaea sp.]